MLKKISLFCLSLLCSNVLGGFSETKCRKQLVYPQEAECEKMRMDVKYQADAVIADSSREYQMQKANYDMEVNAKVSPLSPVEKCFHFI